MSGNGDRTQYDPMTMSRVDVDAHVAQVESEVSDGSAHRRSPLGKGIVMLVSAIAVAVATAIVIRGSSNSETTARGPGIALSSGGDGTVGSVTTLPAPPANLRDMCSTKTIANATSYVQCEKLCESAVCCRLPPSDRFSCLVDNESYCMAYNAACEHLDSARDKATVEIPPAPLDLADWCDPQGKNGLEECEKACMKAECCYETTLGKNCFFDRAECDNYSPCMILTDSKTSDHGHAPGSVGADIVEKCSGNALSGSGEALTDCVSSCSEGFCCFLDEGEEGSCLMEKGQDWCDQFAPCAFVYDRVSSTLSSPSASFETLVTKACKGSDSVSLFGHNTNVCDALCDKGECCFRNGADSCVNAGVDVDCHEYMGCSAVHAEEPKDDKKDPDTTKTLVKAACSEDSLKLAGGDDACKSVCAAGSCCFEKSTNGCAVDCFDYTDCAFLYKDDKEDESTPTKQVVDAACSEGALNVPGGSKACESICEPGKCCFAMGTTNCLGAGIDVNCHDYVSCFDNVGANGKDFDEKAGGDTDTLTKDQETKAKVDAACLDGDKAKCSEVCAAGDCCFGSGENGCLGRNLDVDCHLFVNCASLHETATTATTTTTTPTTPPKTEHTTKSIVDAACSNVGDKTSHAFESSPQAASSEACGHVCEAGKCCFEGIENKCFNSVNCIDYVGCSEYFAELKAESATSSTTSNFEDQETGYSSATKSMIDSACSGNLAVPGADQACQALCKAGGCCFRSDAQNCYNTGVDINCHDYSSCKGVDDGTSTTGETGETSEEKSAVEKEIDIKCSTQALSQPGGIPACVEACTPSFCCFVKHSEAKAAGWKPDSSQCSGGHGDDNWNGSWCDDYSGCEILDSYTHVVVHAEGVSMTAIESACSSKAVAVFGDQDLACEKLCEEGACCFMSGEDSCIERGLDVDCNLYMACDDEDDDEIDDDNDPGEDPGFIDPVDIEEANFFCDEAYVRTNGADSCIEKCEEYLCCFDDGEAKKQCSKLKSQCELFRSCHIAVDGDELLEIGHPDKVAEECQPEDVATVEGRYVCKELCDASQRHCCWVSGSENCYSEKKDWCDEYSACKILY